MIVWAVKRLGYDRGPQIYLGSASSRRLVARDVILNIFHGYARSRLLPECVPPSSLPDKSIVLHDYFFFFKILIRATSRVVLQ